MLLQANCKINIGLRVLNRREDGYHNLSTFFYPVYGLYDLLDITPAPSFSFHSTGIAVDCAPEDNLLLRCYRLMQSRFPAIGNVAIRFHKRIPFGAGLGGGSSDAAHMAIALNQLFSLGLTPEQLAAEVRPLGADCPFFIYNTPCYAEGIGDILRPVTFNLSGLQLLMIRPDIHVSTRDAYRGIPTHPNGKLPLPDNHIISLSDQLINDFEQTVFPLHPLLASIKQRLLAAGAVYAAMSGSGSTIFGLFQQDTEGRPNTQLRLLHEEFASMVIFHDTLP